METNKVKVESDKEILHTRANKIVKYHKKENLK